jgi:hypothetical protein
MVFLNPRLGIHSAKVCVFTLMATWPATFAATPSAAEPDAQTIADIQCLVVGARLGSSPDQLKRHSAQMLLTYFLGRLDGRSPGLDLLSLIPEQANKLSLSTDFADAAQRCGSELTARGAELVRIGKSLGQLGY